ncbi:hypothetical protein ES703_39695 [subsurface metagenome]
MKGCHNRQFIFQAEVLNQVKDFNLIQPDG